MIFKVTNTLTGTQWIYTGLRKTSKELHIDTRYILAYCNGQKQFYNGVYVWEIIK